MGKTPSRNVTEYWNNGDHDWVSIKDLGSYGKYVGRTKETISNLGVAESRIKVVPENTLIMSFKLSLGKTAITVAPTYTNEAIMAFLNKKAFPIDLNYMYHQFSAKDWTAGTNIAVMGKTLNKKTLGAAHICVPNIETQREIASRLDYVCEQIRLVKQQLALLDELVKSRFVEMFGDPASNPKRFPAKPGSELFRLGNGKTKPVSQRFNNGVPAYGGNGITWYTDEAMTSGPTIVLGRVGRHCGNARLVIEPCWVTDNAMYIKNFYDSSLDFIYLINLMSIVKFNRYADEGDLWKITQRPFMEFEFPLPPLALQHKFSAFVQRVDKLRVEAQAQKEKLQTLYDSLAQEYFAI